MKFRSINRSKNQSSGRGSIMRKQIMKLGILAALVALSAIVVVPASHAEWVKDGIPIAVYDGYQGDQDVLDDGFGGVFIVWQDARFGDDDVYAQRVDALGNELWTPGGVNVSGPLAGEQRVARMVADVSGGFIVVYEDNNSGNYDIKAQNVDAGGNVLWTPGGVTLCSETGDQKNVVVVSDGAGGVIAVWEDSRFGGKDVYTQRVNHSGFVQWAANGVVICDEANDQGAIAAVTSGSGGALIAWQDFRSGTNFDVYAQRVNSSGASQWTADGVVVCDQANSQYLWTMVTDEADGGILAWTDLRNGTDDDVYAQRILADGSLDWPVAGVGINTSYGDQSYPAAVADGSGGAIIAFTAYGGLNEDNIRVQRLNSSGSALWSTGGKEICGMGGVQEFVSIIPAEDSGAFIAWEDERWGNVDLYIQKVDSLGAASWVNDGVPIVRAADLQVNIRMAEASDGGCIATWMDRRNGYWDQYCQRIDKSGEWGYMAPKNLVIKDVPYDQGGYVTLTYDASILDAYPGTEITQYVIYRSLTGPPSYAWSGVASFIPTYQETYTWTEATTADSSGSGPAYHYYKVRAGTADWEFYWETLPDSGYSVDNTVPAAPSPVIGEQKMDPGGLEITWAAGSEPDLSHYAVYRGTSEGFAATPDNRIAVPTEPRYLDNEWQWSSGYCYKIAAVDIHDNQSAFAVLLADDVTGADTPAVRYTNGLEQNAPNPFNPTTRITFEIADRADVSLKIYDAQGRLVRDVVNRAMGPGRYEEMWDGRVHDGSPAASGVYFYKLTAGSFIETKKMILLK